MKYPPGSNGWMSRRLGIHPHTAAKVLEHGGWPSSPRAPVEEAAAAIEELKASMAESGAVAAEAGRANLTAEEIRRAAPGLSWRRARRFLADGAPLLPPQLEAVRALIAARTGGDADV